jgi:ABC-2 type transport system ATP-binding protein
MTAQINILTKRLSKNFGNFTAVKDVSFQIQQGEIFGFLGPNGSGKTTTIRMMLGLLTPTSGSVEVLGSPVPIQIQEVLPRIGYMSQQFSLYNDLSVRQNLDFYSRAYGIEAGKTPQKIQEAITLSGLEGYEHTRTSDLSGGWRQRLALSAAIIHNPEVLFLDEPTAGVDPVSRRAFWDLLYQLVADGVTVFITTHYMDEAEHCHRLAFIQHGAIIAQGTPSSIKRDSMRSSVLEIDTPQPEDLMQILASKDKDADLGDLAAELYGSLIHIFTPRPDFHTPILHSLASGSGIYVRSITGIDPSLEDVFISCMKNRENGGNNEN